MARRGIGEAVVAQVLAKPEQRFSIRLGREIFQSRLQIGLRRYVVRVFVDTDRQPAEVVTVYRSSRIGKYWRSSS
jgi:hypothetical protein